MTGFSKESIDLVADKWEEIERHNACLQRLLARRKSEVAVEGVFSRIKNSLEVGDAPTVITISSLRASLRNYGGVERK